MKLCRLLGLDNTKNIGKRASSQMHCFHCWREMVSMKTGTAGKLSVVIGLLGWQEIE